MWRLTAESGAFRLKNTIHLQSILNGWERKSIYIISEMQHQRFLKIKMPNGEETDGMMAGFFNRLLFYQYEFPYAFFICAYMP